ncbi:MAG: c-type cytochrome, partial [Planctomycetota bacterium]
MEIGFKQVFLPQLNRVDRCTNCHVGIDDPAMADMELPIRAHSGNVFKHHPLDKFGCTVCHDGQGRAVDAEVAHGEVEHWPAPLLRGELVYTSCSRCHYENDLYGWEEDLYARGGPLEPLDKTELAAAIPAVGAPRSLAITRGKQLVQRSGCLGCHKYRGRGGTLGPEITYVGDKTVHDFDFSRVEGEHTVAGWLYEHFKKPGEVVPGTLMPDADLTDEQARDLTNYMLSLHRKAMPATHTPLPPRRSGEPVSGAQLFAMYCSSCHGKRGVGATVRDPAMAQVVDAPRELMTPSLNNPDALAVASDDYLRQIITTGRHGTSMIDWKETGGLGSEEIDRLVAFIRSWEPAPPPMERISAARGNPHYGRALYSSRCAGCHGLHGEGGAGGAALNTPAFLAVASDEFLRDSIVYGRANTAMPSWKQLEADQVSDLLAYIRTWQPQAPDKQAVLDRSLTVAARIGEPDERTEDNGEAVYQSRCAACHGSNGEGALGPSLNSDAFLSIVDDEYLYTAIVEGRPGTAMPSWTHLAANEVAGLIDYMRGWNDRHRRELEPFVARGDWDRGRIIFQGACSACHGANAEGGTGAQLNNPVFLASASDAMLREWISYGKTATAMGAFLRGSHGVVELTESQVEDVITYLRRFETEPRVVVARSGTGIAALGAEIYAEVCAACHGPDEDEAAESDLTNPDFLRAASDGYLEATIVLERDM